MYTITYQRGDRAPVPHYFRRSFATVVHQPEPESMLDGPWLAEPAPTTWVPEDEIDMDTPSWHSIRELTPWDEDFSEAGHTECSWHARMSYEEFADHHGAGFSVKAQP